MGKALLLVVFVTVAGSPVADEAEDKAVAALEKLGGKVRRDKKIDGQPVDAVYWTFANATDHDLAILKNFKRLKSLGMTGNMTDAGMINLKGLTHLKFIMLGGSKITDKGLRHIAGLTEVRILALHNTTVTNDGLRYLKGMKKLQILLLNGTKITDAGLMYLKDLGDMRFLGLGDTDVTDAGLLHLKGMSKLDKLDLKETNVTDQGIVELKKTLPKIQIER